jgi:hypothetical protein
MNKELYSNNIIMPTGKNWLNFIYVQVIFVVQILAIYYFISLKQIQDNWPLYRCNPMYMPLSNNIQQDFVYCVQNMQSSFMGYLLQPLTYVTTMLSSLGGEFMVIVNNVREMFNKIRNFITSIIQSVFGVFLNLVIEFQKITIGIKDMIGKMIGIMVTLMYVMDGSVKTMQSTWNGPPGQLVRALGHCFDPLTSIKLKDGQVVKMKDINLGDVLEDGSKVTAVMKIDNDKKEELYRFNKSGVNDEPIYVTGSHLIYNNGKFICVKDHPKAILVPETEKKLEWFSCLITNTHKIKIGKEIFWDWEDYIIKLQGLKRN